MPRIDLTVSNQTTRPEDCQQISYVDSDLTNQHQFTNDGNVDLCIRAVSSATVRFSYHHRGNLVTRDVLLGAGTDWRAGLFDPVVFNQHAGGADPTKVYIDQVGGANGHLRFAAARATVKR